MLRLLPAKASCTNLVQKDQFPELTNTFFDFLAINFSVWSRIMSTVVGDALTSVGPSSPWKRRNLYMLST